jgi:GNAT superfamily N-acetyltransferase
VVISSWFSNPLINQAKILNNNQIKIRKVRTKDLDEFARNTLSDPAFGDIAPISLLRAKSQSKNPQGEPDDLALLVALHENRCVGYHGLLPGLLKIKDSVSKIYWLVTFYLDAGFRGKGYGKQLVTEIQNTNVDLVTTGITKAAAGVYRSSGFRQLGELPFYQLRPENTSTFTAVLQNLKPREKTFTSKSVNRLTEKLKTANARQDSSISFQREIETINWMIRSPWVVSRQEAQEDVKPYYFSRVRDLFKFIPLEIFAPDGKACKGYLVLSISRKKNKTILKVLDFYFHDPKDIFIAGYFALKYAKDYRADRLEYPVGLKTFLGDQTGLKHLLKRKKRLYLFYPRSNDSPLARLAEKIKLNYCDSDTAFT